MANNLNFDGTGKLLGNSALGPVTLSGVDVASAAIEGNALVVHGNRVALVAVGDGKDGLERRVISSTTQIFPSLRHGDKNKFHAAEEMRITVQPDATGNFDTALAAIFADGLAQLASAVPLYWKCYAASYFIPASISEDAENTVTHCVTTAADESAGDADVKPAYNAGPSIVPPIMKVQAPPKYSMVAGEMMVSGVVVVHLRIGTDGVPVGLQIIRALGAGLDEEALKAASQYRFKPATREGIPVPVNANIDVQFHAHP